MIPGLIHSSLQEESNYIIGCINQMSLVNSIQKKFFHVPIGNVNNT